MRDHRTAGRALILLAALLAWTACQDQHEYDLSIGPFLDLLDASPTTATIGWEDAFPDATEFRLERRKEGRSNFKNISGKLGPDVRSFADGELKEKKGYFYRLRAKFKGGALARSVILKVPADLREEMQAEKTLAAVSFAPEWGELAYLGSVPGEPRLSPDGATLAFLEGGRILLLDTASGSIVPAPKSPAGVRGLAWTPDGAALAVWAGPAGAERLFLLDPVTGVSTSLPDAGEGGGDPDVSPDGDRVVFVREEGILETVLRGGRAALLVAGRAAKPRWSPDGERLAYLLEEDGDVVVVTAPRRPDGSLVAARIVGSGASGEGPLVWSPDGSRLAFRIANGGTRVVEIATTAAGGGR